MTPHYADDPLSVEARLRQQIASNLRDVVDADYLHKWDEALSWAADRIEKGEL